MKILFSISFFLLAHFVFAQIDTVKVGDYKYLPLRSSDLPEIKIPSDTTTTVKINGVLVFNTNKLYVWNGKCWQLVASNN